MLAYYTMPYYTNCYYFLGTYFITTTQEKAGIVGVIVMRGVTRLFYATDYAES